MRTVLPNMVRWVGVLLLAAPLPIGVLLLGERLSEGPDIQVGQVLGSTPRIEPIGPLLAGDRRVVVIPEGEQVYSGVVAFVATYRTQPVAEFEVCAAGRCATSTHRVRDNSLVHLPFPTAARGGEITVSLRSVSDGSLAWWAEEGQPLLKPVTRHGWPLAMARAAESFRMQAGDFWWELLVGGAIAFIGILGVVIWRACVDRHPRFD